MHRLSRTPCVKEATREKHVLQNPIGTNTKQANRLVGVLILGRRQKGASGRRVRLYILIWVLVTQVCSFCDNSWNRVFMIRAFLCIESTLQFKALKKSPFCSFGQVIIAGCPGSDGIPRILCSKETMPPGQTYQPGAYRCFREISFWKSFTKLYFMMQFYTRQLSLNSVQSKDWLKHVKSLACIYYS